MVKSHTIGNTLRSRTKNTISLISKCLMLVIMCNVSTLALIAIIFVSVFIKVTILQTIIHSWLAAIDTLVAVFAIYSHFTFGDWLYRKICFKCDSWIENRFMTVIRENGAQASSTTPTTPTVL